MRRVITALFISLFLFVPSALALGPVPTCKNCDSEGRALPEVAQVDNGVSYHDVVGVSDATLKRIQEQARFVKIWNAKKNLFICVMVVSVSHSTILRKGDQSKIFLNSDASFGGLVMVNADQGMCD